MSVVISTLPVENQPQGPVEFLELTWEERCKPRRKFVTQDGANFALSLERGKTLAEGTTVYNTSERTIIVKAKSESVMAIRPSNILQFCQVAHNLGNWHRSMQVEDESIFTQGDSPLEEWLKRHQIAFGYVEQPYSPNLCSHAHD